MGLSEKRGMSFWGRSQVWNQQNSFNIPNPGGVAVLQERRGEERRGKTSAWDMMRLELREGGRGRKKLGWVSDGTAGLASPGEHGGMRGGAITTLQRTKRGRACLYLHLDVCECVASAHRASYSTAHNDSSPSSLQSMSKLPIETAVGQSEPLLPLCEPIRSKQWQGKLCPYEMHCK